MNIQISLRISAFCTAYDAKFVNSHIEDSAQTARMRSLSRVFVVRS